MRRMIRWIAVMVCMGNILFADALLQQILTFSVEGTTNIGHIFGPAPVFRLKGGEKSQSIVNTYSIATNETNKKISAYLDQDMPDGTSLVVSMAPPRGARSLEEQELSATPIDLVIELSKVSQSGLALTYTFSTTPEAGMIPTTTRTVTYTIIDG